MEQISTSVLSSNTGKHGLEKTPYLDIFHAVYGNSGETSILETQKVFLGTILYVASRLKQNKTS